MKKCNGCGKWWREDDRRMLSAAALPLETARRCKASGKSVPECCGRRAGERCYKCNSHD